MARGPNGNHPTHGQRLGRRCSDSKKHQWNVIMLGGHLILFASKLQKTVALSSGEAELNALVSGLTEALGVCSLCTDWHSAFPVQCFCDSSAARGIALRTGVGKMKHLQVRQLWVQEQVRLNRASVAWIPRGRNTADAFTH